jgi:hypothetical protein
MHTVGRDEVMEEKKVWQNLRSRFIKLENLNKIACFALRFEYGNSSLPFFRINSIV